MPSVLLLTGRKGIGKTTACLGFWSLSRDRGLHVGGIVCPATYDGAGLKTGIDALDALTGERCPLAVVAATDQPGERVGRYRFDPAVMAWALARVLAALQAPLDAAIIDEIGPLELDRGGGFALALARLTQARSRQIILVVRPALVARLESLLAHLEPQRRTLSIANRDDVPDDLLQVVAGSPPAQA
jgi:nucleoside-triphosphatase THEP1